MTRTRLLVVLYLIAAPSIAAALVTLALALGLDGPGYLLTMVGVGLVTAMPLAYAMARVLAPPAPLPGDHPAAGVTGVTGEEPAGRPF